MNNYSFYPFKKAFNDIDGEDLLRLRDISEGWYIDYKSQVQPPNKLGKYISSFANQQGGWLIFGVTEKDRKADQFIGIDANEVEKMLDRISKAVSAHIIPSPLFEEKVVQGAIEEIDLPENKAIIIIGIPESKNTPHIHSSGCIYRRVGDQSEPIKEIDRYTLDKLWEKSYNYKKKIATELTTIPELPKEQHELAWAHIYFKPSSIQHKPEKLLSYSDFRKVIGSRSNSSNFFTIKMPMIYSALEGYIAQAPTNENPHFAPFTFRWWHNGTARFDIPLTVYYSLESFEKNTTYNYKAQYLDVAKKYKYQDLKIVDYTNFLHVFAALINYYLNILEVRNDKRDIHSCFSLRNVLYTSPYSDFERFIERINEQSIPLIIENDLSYPKEPAEENMFLLDYKTREACKAQNQENFLPYIFSIPLIAQLFNAVGISPDLHEFQDDLESILRDE